MLPYIRENVLLKQITLSDNSRAYKCHQVDSQKVQIADMSEEELPCIKIIQGLHEDKLHAARVRVCV